MIQNFVDRFMSARENLRLRFTANEPRSYEALVRTVVEVISDRVEYATPDPDRITVVDHGDYQGTLLFIIADKGYQPSRFWSVMCYYGSCSCCDTLQGIHDLDTAHERIDQYMTLALHVVQRMKEV